MPGFNNPWQFSFKDVLAIMFSGTFLYFCYRVMFVSSALDLVKTLIAPISIILGGYFVQEGAAMWLTRSHGQTGITCDSAAYTTTAASNSNSPP